MKIGVPACQPVSRADVRARSRTDAYEFRERGLYAIRETLHSSLEVARQSLVTLGEGEDAASRIVEHFTRHDREQFEKTFVVRHDRQALMTVSQQGRQDLKALLAAEREAVGQAQQES